MFSFFLVRWDVECNKFLRYTFIILSNHSDLLTGLLCTHQEIRSPIFFVRPELAIFSLKLLELFIYFINFGTLLVTGNNVHSGIDKIHAPNKNRLTYGVIAD